MCDVVLQVMYLDQVVDRLLLGHHNSGQHKSLLQQHKTGGMTPTQQVGQHGVASICSVCREAQHPSAAQLAALSSATEATT
jgi:hypothetical protein